MARAVVERVTISDREEADEHARGLVLSGTFAELGCENELEPIISAVWDPTGSVQDKARELRAKISKGRKALIGNGADAAEAEVRQ
jgi:hypothetical protein